MKLQPGKTFEIVGRLTEKGRLNRVGSIAMDLHEGEVPQYTLPGEKRTSVTGGTVSVRAEDSSRTLELQQVRGDSVISTTVTVTPPAPEFAKNPPRVKAIQNVKYSDEVIGAAYPPVEGVDVLSLNAIAAVLLAAEQAQKSHIVSSAV